MDVSSDHHMILAKVNAKLAKECKNQGKENKIQRDKLRNQHDKDIFLIVADIPMKDTNKGKTCMYAEQNML